MLRLQIEAFGPHHEQVMLTMGKVHIVEAAKSHAYEHVLEYIAAINIRRAKLRAQKRTEWVSPDSDRTLKNSRRKIHLQEHSEGKTGEKVRDIDVKEIPFC